MRAERVRVRGAAWWFAGRLAAIAVAAVATLQSGCGGDDDGGGGDDDERPFAARRASEVRELDFREDVDVVRMTRAEFQEQAAENAEEADEAELRELADTYGRLGYFPIDADLRPTLASTSDWVGASYSPTGKVITLVEDSPGDFPTSTEVHEYVHALQDQHFDLLAYDRPTSDEFLARRAVVEGDATLAEARFVAQDEHDGDLDGWDWPTLIDYYREFGDGLLEEAQYPVFVAYPSFVYSSGLQYTAQNLLGAFFEAPAPHDWSLEDELFTERPPATSRQVSWGDQEIAPVERVGLDAVPPELEERLEAVNWDALGTWYVYLLFYPRQPLDEMSMSSEWRGDRVLFVRDRERDGAVATVWASAWASSDVAALVTSGLHDLYGVDTKAPPMPGTAADGEAVWIEVRAGRVVAIKNLDPELMSQVAEAAFAPPDTPRARRSRPPLPQRLLELSGLPSRRPGN